MFSTSSRQGKWEHEGRPAFPWFAPAAALALAAIALAAWFASRHALPETARYDRLTLRAGYISGARFTPDAKSVIYSASWEGGPHEVFASGTNAPESRPLSVRAALATVSREGELGVLLDPRQLYPPPADLTGTLAIMPLSGGALNEMLPGVGGADFHPSGKDFAVLRGAPGACELQYPAGKTLYRSSGVLSHPRFARNALSIAFVEHAAASEERGRPAALRLATGKVEHLTDEWASVGGVVWSWSGEEIWFSACRDGRDWSIWAVTLKKRLRLVAQVPGGLKIHDIARDGRALVERIDSRDPSKPSLGTLYQAINLR